MAKKIQVDELEYKRLQVQDRKVAALLEAQKDLTLAMKDLVGYWKVRDMERQVDAMENRNIVIIVEDGRVKEVCGLPENWTFEVNDFGSAGDEEFTPVEEMDDVTEGVDDGEPWKRGGYYG